MSENKENEVKIECKIQATGWVCNEFKISGNWEQVQKAFNIFLSTIKELKELENKLEK